MRSNYQEREDQIGVQVQAFQRISFYSQPFSTNLMKKIKNHSSMNKLGKKRGEGKNEKREVETRYFENDTFSISKL